MSIIGDGIVLGEDDETASIVVTAPTGSTVTCTTPIGIVLTASEISGTWAFSRLKSYGTYTVTATDGTSTKTQDVLVDAAAVFDVSINYNKVKNGNFASGYDNWSFEGTGSSTYWYKRLIPYGERNYLQIGADAGSTYSAVQTVDFTGASELSFYANFASGTSACTFLVYVGSITAFSAVYGDTIGMKSIPVSYSGNQTLKFTAKKTNPAGNAVFVNITDISVH